MLIRRLTAVAAAGITLVALAGCRTSPNVAAYVGDAQVTVTELQAAVDDRVENPDVAAYAESREDEFIRRVLSLLIQEEVYEAAAERYGVRVDDDEVRARIDELLGDDEPADVFGQLAQQGIGQEDVVENVRQQLLRREIAESQGAAEGVTDDALRARYEEIRESLGQVSFGYITVPDEATAATVLAQLTADPASYPAVAAQYPGPATLPTLEPRSPDQVPSVLAEGIAAAAPNSGFATAIPEAGGVVVTFVEGTVYPSFEEIRPQLEEEAAGAVEQEGGRLVAEVRSDLGVTVNPRYGVLEDGQLVPAEGGVVDILGDDAAAAEAAGN